MEAQSRLYMGTKFVKACPQVKDGIQGYSVMYYDGYESWSPKDVFDASYRLMSDTEKNMVMSSLE